MAKEKDTELVEEVIEDTKIDEVGTEPTHTEVVEETPKAKKTKRSKETEEDLVFKPYDILVPLVKCKSIGRYVVTIGDRKYNYTKVGRDIIVNVSCEHQESKLKEALGDLRRV